MFCLVACSLAGCDMLDMYDQPRYKPLAASEFFPDGMSARPLIAGTIARGQLHEDSAFYTGKVDGRYVDELPIELDAGLLDRGRERFNLFCSACHGQTGYGNGMVVERGFKRPPSYHTPRVRGLAVGNFFEIMTNGFGEMPPLNLQTEPRDRWAIAAYIRALQLSQDARLDDVPDKFRTTLREATDFRLDDPGAQSPFGTAAQENVARPASESLPDRLAPPDRKQSELQPESRP